MNHPTPAQTIQPAPPRGFLVLLACLMVPVMVLLAMGYVASVLFSLAGLSISDMLWFFAWF